MNVQDLFDRGAADYDLHRRKVIPCFDDFYNTLISQVPFARQDRFTFLDLGAGTGLVSALILGTFANARAHLADLSPKMLEKARARFAGNPQVEEYHTMDYSKGLPPGEYDLVVSAMSIHHLLHEQKKALFKTICNRLTPGAKFIHADLIQGSTPETEAFFQKKWQDHIKGCGFDPDSLAQLWARMDADRPARLKDQLDWMARAGFEPVALCFESDNFAVYAGVKPAGTKI